MTVERLVFRIDPGERSRHEQQLSNTPRSGTSGQNHINQIVSLVAWIQPCPTYQEFFRLCFVIFNFFCGCYEYFQEGEGAKM